MGKDGTKAENRCTTSRHCGSTLFCRRGATQCGDSPCRSGVSGADAAGFVGRLSTDLSTGFVHRLAATGSGGHGRRMPSATTEPPAPPDPPCDVPRLRLSSPTHLLAAVPYLLGFHLSDSLVLVGIRDRQVAVVLRVDLPPAPATGPPPDPGEVIGYLLDVLGRQDPVRLVLVGYGPAGRVDPFVAEVRAAFTACDVPVLDALRVADGRYWSLTRREPSG